jgi:hypothetical protein
MPRVTSKSFYESWLKAVEAKETELIEVWDTAEPYTEAVLGCGDSIVAAVAESHTLKHYSEYYSMDALMFDPGSDKIQDHAPNRETWLCRARVALEHENEFFSGLYKEVGHLLILDCDLRVLVTYPPEQHTGVELVLSGLSSIIEQSGKSDLLSEHESFLLIFGFKLNDDPNIRWSARVFKEGQWAELK